MQPTLPPTPPKPISRIWRPDLTRLPALHWRRRFFRQFVRILARLLIRLLTRSEFQHLDRIPARGPALIVLNHLGDADTAILLAALPFAPEALGKIELLSEFPILGRLMDWYGVIWLHRGRPDRRALGVAVEALGSGRFVVIAPEGRYTLTRGLEKGTGGAAYVAMRARVSIIPIALTGTENAHVYGSLRRWRRPGISLTVGRPFSIKHSESPQALRLATQEIMEALARLLPEDRRGVYAAALD